MELHQWRSSKDCDTVARKLCGECSGLLLAEVLPTQSHIGGLRVFVSATHTHTCATARIACPLAHEWISVR
eukprot:565234-Amphidinium_carterae.1